MQGNLIMETRNLSYRFGNQQALEDVSLRVSPGSIYGFLGPNGAGKTTMIKVLLNLLQYSEGKVFLFGKELKQNRVAILSGIGSLIEQPAFYHHLTGRENLLNRARLLRVPLPRVDEILKLVDLTGNAGKKAGKYSLGMKQRLGIGLALLPDPELLILDEPTNGLDPNGIIEIRYLLRKLVSEQGKTVFLSSHLLSEAEKMVTHVGIINRGKLLFQGTIEELHNVSKKQVLIQTNNINQAKDLLSRNGYQADILSEIIHVPYISGEQMADINHLLVNHEHKVYSLTKSKQDLENLFLSFTQN